MCYSYYLLFGLSQMIRGGVVQSLQILKLYLGKLHQLLINIH